jgi:hypothetical protein
MGHTASVNPVEVGIAAGQALLQYGIRLTSDFVIHLRRWILCRRWLVRVDIAFTSIPDQ